MTRGPSTASTRAVLRYQPFGDDRRERPRDEPIRAGDEAGEETDERADEAQEHDPDAPGLGIFRDDDLEDIPEPNEPS
jgi:hypothetical protein